MTIEIAIGTWVDSSGRLCIYTVQVLGVMCVGGELMWYTERMRP